MNSRGLRLLYQRLELAIEELKMDVVGYHSFDNIIGYSSGDAERFLEARRLIGHYEYLMDYIYELDCEMAGDNLEDNTIRERLH